MLDLSNQGVLFIRHAFPVVDANTAPRSWPLSGEGRRAAVELARRLQLSSSTQVISSDETKAVETAEAFSGDVVVDPRLREAERPWSGTNYAHLASAWLRGKSVEGWEPRETVIWRMAEAVEQARGRSRVMACLVTHGLSMSAFVADVTGVDGEGLWRGLQFPDARVVDLTAGRVVDG